MQLFWVEHVITCRWSARGCGRFDALSGLWQETRWRVGCQHKYGGNKNLEAIEFLKHLNSLRCFGQDCPGIMTDCRRVYRMAEGDNEKVRRMTALDFHMKWNMGWMHDFLEYMKTGSRISASYNHNKMTIFSMTYAYSGEVYTGAVA